MVNESLIYTFSKSVDEYGKPVGEMPLFDALYQEFDYLKGVEVTWPEAQGACSHVAFVGDYVVKSPMKTGKFRLDKTTAFFISECDYLTKIDHPLVPKIKHISEHFNFCVMEKMPGILLEETSGKRTLEQDARIADTLVKLSFDLSKALPVEDCLDKKPCDEQDIQHLIQLVEKPNYQDLWGAKRCEEYMNVLTTFEDIYNSVDPVMHHGDFHRRNILVNPDDYGEVTGVIDFGNVKKYKLPEVHSALEFLYEGIRRKFSNDYYYQRTNKKTADILSLSNAFVKVEQAVRCRYSVDSTELYDVDDLVRKCNIPATPKRAQAVGV